MRDQDRFDRILEQLKRHKKENDPLDIRKAFRDDPQRFKKFSLKCDDFLMDFSKTALDTESLALLLELSQAADITGWRDAMFRGECINVTEKRAVLHTALRVPKGAPIYGSVNPLLEEIHKVHDCMERFVRDVHSGTISGFTKKPFTHVVNIGIGGSHLGPQMVAQALGPCPKGLVSSFVSNIDPTAMEACLQKINPETTLFVIASKTFTTLETLKNAHIARDFIAQALGEEAVPYHFVATTAHPKRACAFGIQQEFIFPFLDSIGGRYSLWGAIGLPALLSIGWEKFVQLLEGAHAMDMHFKEAPLEENLPVLFALVTYYHHVICGFCTRAIVPYAHNLRGFLPYVQQLEMESNGKSTTLSGTQTKTCTSPVIWGGVGTDAQHAFFQLLHQGTLIAPVEFIAFMQNSQTLFPEAHALLVASCLAQAEALLQGRPLSPEDREASVLEAHRAFAGNRPSLLFIQKELTPKSLGRLLALYEHRIFVEAALFHVNAFDQWGVELGKELTDKMLPFLLGETVQEDMHSSSQGLLCALQSYRRS